MNTLKYIISLLLLTLVLPTFAQDDDFFLRNDEEKEDSDEILESTEFTEGSIAYIDDVVNRRLVEDGRVVPYPDLEEIDVVWEKRIWRVIDLREKMNQPFRNEDRPFFTIVKDLVDNGDIKVFADERFREPLGADDVRKLLNKVDTTSVLDPETYEQKIVIADNPINPQDIQKYRVKEVWYFDKKNSRVKVRILGIAPIQDVFDDETGLFKYSTPLFWMYYPKARKHLAKERVPNNFNDISSMTWYQLLEDRFFASYITKASNSLGLRLEDIHPDSEYDRLLMGELIKQELFNWEHDLWTY